MAQHAHWHPSAIEILFSGLEKAVREGKTGDNNFQPVVYQSIASDLREAGFSFNVEQVKSRWRRVSLIEYIYRIFGGVQGVCLLWQFKTARNDVHYLRSLSGVGWDDVRQVVVASEEVWKGILLDKVSF